MRTFGFPPPPPPTKLTMVKHHLFKPVGATKPFPLVSAHVLNGQTARTTTLKKQTGTLERVPDLRLFLERKTGFEPATLTLARL